MMKLIIMLMSLIIPVSVFAVEQTYSWIPNAAEDNVTSYTIAYGSKARKYDTHINVGIPAVIDGRMSATVDIPGNTPICVSIYATNAGGDSQYGKEVFGSNSSSRCVAITRRGVTIK